MSDPARLVVLISGSGTNLQAVLDACDQRTLHAQVAAVISNKLEAFGLQRARQAGVPAICVAKKPGQTRSEYDTSLSEMVSKFNPDLVILAGWMRLLSIAFLSQFPQQVINLHPALPGTFPGAHAIKEAFDAFQAGSIGQTGVMVHYVPDEGVDNGPVILQEPVRITQNDTLESLEGKIHAVEHRLLVQAISQVLQTKE